MGEESRRERILLGAWGVLSHRKAGSKDCREIADEAPLFQERTTALDSEGTALPAGPGAHIRTGSGREKAGMAWETPSESAAGSAEDKEAPISQPPPILLLS